MTATPEAKHLEAIAREALENIPEEMAVRMMAAYRKGRTVCLMLTEHGVSHQTKAEWVVLAPDELAPGGET
jgi:hypothetical protein